MNDGQMADIALTGRALNLCSGQLPWLSLLGSAARCYAARQSRAIWEMSAKGMSDRSAMTKIYPEYLHQIHDLFVNARAPFPFPRHPVHRNEGYHPFFIIGSGRSGNTLLRRILNNHSRLYIPPETYVLGASIKAFRQVSHMRWHHIVNLIYSLLQFQPEFETFQVDTLFPLVERVRSAPKKERSLAFILGTFYQWHADMMGVSFDRWGDKTPANVFALNRIYKVFPDAQFIHIIRDGCDVVASYLESGIYSDLETAAWRWRTAVNLACRFGRKHPQSYLEIRYEDLVSNPRGTVQDVCGFLEVDFEENMVLDQHTRNNLGDVNRRKHHKNVLEPVSDKYIGKGRRQLAQEQKSLLDKLILNDLRALGYPPCT